MAGETGHHPVAPALLAAPLLLNANHPHPFLCLGDYFSAVTGAIHRHQPSIEAHLARGSGRRWTVADVRLVSVKMGAFYHVARLDLTNHDDGPSLAVNTACSAIGKVCLRVDAGFLTRLAADNSGLPRVVFFEEGADREDADGFCHLAVEWFAGYHEWHATRTEHGTGCCLWDGSRGRRLLSSTRQREILAGCARILVRSYDIETGAMVQRWHHAAGDFIVKSTEREPVAVKLITVRDHAPLPFLGQDAPPLVHLLYFFLDLCFRLRLDKMDGVGDTCWLPSTALNGAVDGFFSELAVSGPERRSLAAELRRLLPRFSPGELAAAAAPLLAWYDTWLPEEDVRAVTDRVGEHLLEVLAAIPASLPSPTAPQAPAGGDDSPQS